MAPPKPWTAAEVARRHEILSTAHAKGITHKQLAEGAGLPSNSGQVKLSRWMRGAAHLGDDVLARMESLLKGGPTPVHAGPAGSAVPVTDEVVRSELATLDEVAGVPDPDEKDPLKALAKAHRRSAVGALVRLLVSAKSEQVKVRAAELLLERSDGKAIQTVIDMTPKPPATSEELVAAIQKAIDQTKKGPSGVPPPANR